MNLKYLISKATTFPLLPLLYIQGKKIRENTPILPEASDIQGETYKDSERTLRIITVGDSSMAGVGVKTHTEGFIGILSVRLSSYYNTNIWWKVYAKSGYTALKVKNRLVPTVNDVNLDLIVIGVGGNDAFKLTSPKEWINNIKALIADIRIKYRYQPIIFINMPPVREIPAFTSLIKYIMGNLIDAYSYKLAKYVKKTDNVFYCSRKISYRDYTKRYKLNSHPSDFFSNEDKFHPSKLAYEIWAKDVSDFIIKNKVINNVLHS